jgi:hypothetical protein
LLHTVYLPLAEQAAQPLRRYEAKYPAAAELVKRTDALVGQEDSLFLLRFSIASATVCSPWSAELLLPPLPVLCDRPLSLAACADRIVCVVACCARRPRAERDGRNHR